MLLWAIAVALTLVGNMVLTLLPRSEEMAEAIQPTDSLVERFGLFTIIVLGEVVVGVADGVSAAEHNLETIATALLALSIGFGFWWNYFDFVGGRLPRPGRSRVAWMFTHLPLAMSVAAAGAGMVGLIEHAGESQTPTGSALLISGATAGAALSIAGLTMTIPTHPARRAVPYTLTVAAVASLALGVIRPQPWLLALALSMLLSAVWAEGFIRHTRAGVTITDRV